jgi:hypothetical protein
MKAAAAVQRSSSTARTGQAAAACLLQIKVAVAVMVVKADNDDNVTQCDIMQGSRSTCIVDAMA